MLYVHSFSATEQQICKSLSQKTNITQLDIEHVQDEMCVERIHNFDGQKTLIYSFQQFHKYRHLESFQHEVKNVTVLLESIKKLEFQKIILLSYPGAYPYSDNMFLQHKGIIEQLFVASGIPYTILKVQGISSPPMHIMNFHSLFYNNQQNSYIIPKKSNHIIYSVNIRNLSEIILKACNTTTSESFDVFDSVSTMKQFMEYNSLSIPVKTYPAAFLYLQSYLNKYAAPSMFELFLRNTVPMYNFRTEKTFKVPLQSEIFEQLKSAENYSKENEFIFSNKSQLIPVS